MKIITQLVVLTLSLLLVNAGEHCNYLLRKYYEFKAECSPASITINNCCDLTAFPYNKAPFDVYKIRKCMPDCEETAPFTTVTSDVYCNMENGRGGWTMIQKNYIHQDDELSVDFNKKWKDYEEGFGHLEGNFWYGLKSIHCLTQNDPWEMKIEFKLKNGEWNTIHYNEFSIGSPDDEYPLKVGGFNDYDDEDVTDWFSSQLNGIKFSTPDNDNDASSGNCAAQWKSGWWYNNCTEINLNTKAPHISNHRVVYTEMIIRPKDCIIN